MSDVTRILSKIEFGDQQASEELLPLVYDELRKLTNARMAKEDPGRRCRLAKGKTTMTATKWFRASSGRISQIRHELMDAWQSFVGESEEVMTAAIA